MHNDPIPVFNIPRRPSGYFRQSVNTRNKKAEINKKGHIMSRHVSRNDADPVNSRKWFIFVLSQSVPQFSSK